MSFYWYQFFKVDTGLNSIKLAKILKKQSRLNFLPGQRRLTVLPEGLGWKSPLYLSKIPTCPHQIFLPKIPTFCKNFPTFFKKSNNFLKKIPTFCYNFPTFLKNLTIFKKISTFCRKRQKFQSPLEKNDPHQTPQNPHGGDKSPFPATLDKTAKKTQVVDYSIFFWWFMNYACSLTR